MSELTEEIKKLPLEIQVKLLEQLEELQKLKSPFDEIKQQVTEIKSKANNLEGYVDTFLDSSKLRISFDFDNTLSRRYVKKYVKKLLENPLIEIWIVTTRLQEYGSEVYQVAEKLGIDIDKVVFTNQEWKYTFFEKRPDFFIHVDDYPYEIEMINNNTDVKGVSVLSLEWREEVNKLIIDKLNS